VSVATATARTFSSLRRHRNYRLWFGGQLVSMTGTWVQNVAQAWFILQLSNNSPLAVGVLAVCRFGPYAVLGLVGGSVVDRFDKRWTIVWTQVAMMVSAGVLAGIALGHVATVWEVDALAVLSGLANIVDTPARQAFTVEMVGRPELPNAIALNSSMFNASRVIGPALGGLLVAAVGVGICFLINAASFLAVIAGLMLMRPAELHRSERSRTALIRGVGEGLAYVWRTETVRLVVLLMLVSATIGMNFQVIIPVLASTTLHGDASTFGWLSTAFGAGALAGALTVAALHRPSWWILVGALATFATSQVMLAAVDTVWPSALLLVVCGVGFSLYTALSNTTLQLTVPDRLRGRVMAIYGYVFFGTAPLGGLLAGWLCDVGGTGLNFFVSGVTCLGAAGVALAIRRSDLPGRGRRRSRDPVADLAEAEEAASPAR
jgi:MFS family permease